MSAALPLALAALIPVLIGPLPAGAGTITAKLCNGSTITIPIGGGDVPAGNSPNRNGNCHPKGCHAGTCRAKDRLDRAKRGI